MKHSNPYKNQYCESLTEYKRLQTQEVWVGNVPMGSDHPIRLQSMTNTDTNNTAATVEQIKRIANAGADYARMTVRSLKETRNLKNIKDQLLQEGYSIPLVADVHFNTDIAETAATIIEKVRINPGNYAMRYARKGDFEEIRKHFIDLIDICRENNTALRIGVNHGSLSQRIMDLYGDTPRGMTESALEFIKICEEHDFHNTVISLKSSNTRVMVQANRLMIHEMMKKGRIYPLHLGVTEAGEGEDGRIKSAVGIGALLADGIGDTIRVSLTEPPEKEIPVARILSENFQGNQTHYQLPEVESLPIDPFKYQKRRTRSVDLIGGDKPPVVIGKSYTDSALKPDLIIAKSDNNHSPLDISLIRPYEDWITDGQLPDQYPLFNSITHYHENSKKFDHASFVKTSAGEINQLDKLKRAEKVILILEAIYGNPTREQRRFIFELINKEINLPVVLNRKYREHNQEQLRIKAASELGLLFLDGLAEGIFIENEPVHSEKNLHNISYGILQASRSRIYKTEFISCPGCGRTQFNLEKTAEKIRNRMGHLKGLKIAIMGCIVNGPGEMADADYGYVGAGPGKITLYRNREVVKRNIPENQAVEELEKLIQEYGDWEER
jgi:(E)-4-hydroxy-3-methylbut-2-enyl-diphosphate synthase